ncbi:hypothetical protein C0J52_07535 [Blattella germanica]|nr:hypothetical protein C0J52_07535 [Blattella germanica]
MNTKVRLFFIVLLKWIHSYTPELKQKSSEWRHTESTRPRRCQALQNPSKLIVIVYYDYDGIILVHTAPCGIRVNADYYSRFLEQYLRPAWHRKRLQAIDSPIEIHDNARHVATTVRDLFRRWNSEVSVLEHSPDMSPCGSDLFSKITEPL